MATQMAPFNFDTVSQLPAYLQQFGSNLQTDMAVGGLGRNRLGLKGNRFRLIVNGQEEAVLETTAIEVVIVGASPGVGRLFFGGEYDADVKSHPLCYSADGIAPGADVTNPQATKCAVCPQNEKGSKITQDGTKTKACSYFKRMAVVWTGDPAHRVFQLDAKALSIFGQGQPQHNRFTLAEYSAKFKTRGLDPAHFVTKLTFDTDSSVPKLYFSPVRPISEDEATWVQEAVNSDDTKTVCTITAITDTSDADSEAPPVTTPEPAPVKAPATVAKPVPAKPAAAPAASAPRVVSGKPAVTVVKTAAPAPKPAVTIVKAPSAKAAAAPVVQEIPDDDLSAFLSQLDAAEAE